MKSLFTALNLAREIKLAPPTNFANRFFFLFSKNKSTKSEKYRAKLGIRVKKILAHHSRRDAKVDVKT